MASTGIVGFHLTPPVWIGDTLPGPNDEVTLSDLQTEVYRRDLTTGIRARVLHSGVFIFDFSGWPENRDFPTRPTTWEEYDQAGVVIARRVLIINAYLACLYSALQTVQGDDHEKMVLSPIDLVPYTQFGAPPAGIDDLFVLSLTRETRAGTFKVEIDTKLRHAFQQNISTETLAKSFERLEELLARNSDEALLLPEMLLRSRKAFEDLDYNLCLILGWAMTEKMIVSLWDKYIDANRTRTINGKQEAFINAERKKRLKDSRNFTASTVAESLSLLDKVPFDIYSRTLDVRKSRNEWVHDLVPVTREKAEAAVVLAYDVLKFVEGIDLPARRRIRIFLG